MPSVLAALRSFNRKERFLLLQWVLGNQGFRLGDDFRRRLEETSGLDLSGESVVAMDYHLDWLYAALCWATGEVEPGVKVDRDLSDVPAPGDPTDPRPMLITGSQEDIDLLVATAGPGGTTNIVLCEAKAYSPGDRHQLRHKVERLRAIFGDDASRFPSVVPRLVLLAPRPPVIDTTAWPAWMKHPEDGARFLPLPPPEGRYSIHREFGENWSWWEIVDAPWKD